MGVDSYLQLVSVLIIFVVVLAATLYVTKWMANYQKGTSASKNIEIIDTCKISTNKYIQIVRIGDRHVALGITDGQITNLGDVNGDDLVLNLAEGQNLNFKDVLEKIKGEKKEKNDKNEGK